MLRRAAKKPLSALNRRSAPIIPSSHWRQKRTKDNTLITRSPQLGRPAIKHTVKRLEATPAPEGEDDFNARLMITTNKRKAEMRLDKGLPALSPYYCRNFMHKETSLQKLQFSIKIRLFSVIENLRQSILRAFENSKRNVSSAQSTGLRCGGTTSRSIPKRRSACLRWKCDTAANAAKRSLSLIVSRNTCVRRNTTTCQIQTRIIRIIAIKTMKWLTGKILSISTSCE